MLERGCLLLVRCVRCAPSSQASDLWEAALDAMQPEVGSDGEAHPPVSAPPPAPARDPRMAGFRIGGQRETAEERGEGWCGPWSTAMRLVEQREQVTCNKCARVSGVSRQP